RKSEGRTRLLHLLERRRSSLPPQDPLPFLHQSFHRLAIAPGTYGFRYPRHPRLARLRDGRMRSVMVISTVMKAILLTLLCGAVGTMPTPAEFEIWTSQDGRRAEMELVRGVEK